MCIRDSPNKRVMLCAHMDEVGLIVSNIDKYGLIKFKSVGGLDPRILLSKVVLIGDKDVYKRQIDRLLKNLKAKEFIL